MGVGAGGDFTGLPFTTTKGFATLGIMAIVYFVLFLYLSLVLPNENGSNLHPLFFLKCFCSSDKKGESGELGESFELANLSSARYY